MLRRGALLFKLNWFSSFRIVDKRMAAILTTTEKVTSLPPPTKAKSDKKEYRAIQLANGLR